MREHTISGRPFTQVRQRYARVRRQRDRANRGDEGDGERTGGLELAAGRATLLVERRSAANSEMHKMRQGLTMVNDAGRNMILLRLGIVHGKITCGNSFAFMYRDGIVSVDAGYFMPAHHNQNEIEKPSDKISD